MLRSVRWVGAQLLVFILCVNLEAYSVLHRFFSSYSFSYAWAISAAYLNGLSPGIVVGVPLCRLPVLYRIL